MDAIVLAERSAKWAEEAADKLRPRETNTPKKLCQARNAELDGVRLKRAASYLKAIAKALVNGGLPDELVGIKPTKDVLLRIASQYTKQMPNGFHSYLVEDGTWQDESPRAKCLRALAEAPEIDTKAIEIRRMEDALRFADIPGFFPTPRPVIDRLLELAEIGPNMNILEPSAGKGDIADAIREVMPGSCSLHVCEVNYSLWRILEVKGHCPAVAGRGPVDFMSLNGSHYHRIIMNPPFERGQDIKHVMHAYDRLVEGGRLVAIVANGAAWQKSQPWFEELNASSETLDSGAFAGKMAFRQTGVASNIVVIDKPDRRIS